MQSKIPVLVVFGATASGKTALFNYFFSSTSSIFPDRAEIINADSVQVYKGMEIGSASPSDDVLANLPHHLINVRNPDQEFSSADFVDEADILCSKIYARGKLPVLLGGTAFFLKNFIFGLPITPKADPEIRKNLQMKLAKIGIEPLYKMLYDVDPDTAKRLHINDHYRIIRALEVFESSGKPLSSFKVSQQPRNQYSFELMAIYRPREIMYDRIDKRVDMMFEQGLLSEFTKLYNAGYNQTTPAMKAIGYAEFFKVSPNDPLNAPIDKVKKLIKLNTRHYAKRQSTFFRSIPNVSFFNLENEQDKINIENQVKILLSKLN